MSCERKAMAIYEYICRATNEYRTIERPMAKAPKSVFTERGKRWERVWGNVQGAVKAGSERGPYMKGWEVPNIAPTLPPNHSPYRVTSKHGVKVREHADGTYSDRFGHRIVNDAKDMHKTCIKTGREYVQNA